MRMWVVRSIVGGKNCVGGARAAAAAAAAAARRREYGVWAAGQGWTGALGLGGDVMTDKEWSHVSMEERENSFTHVGDNGIEASSGWGHSILLTKAGGIEMAGRPYEFSTLLRLHRLPSFLRIPVIRSTLEQSHQFQQQQQQQQHGNSSDSNPSLWSRWVDTFLHASEHMENEQYYPFSLLPEFTPIPFLDDDDHDELNHISQMEASAGWSAFRTKEGHVYACGVNHYGQCGQAASVSSTVWKPTQIPNLPPASQISCGLQHGMALDMEDGLMYSWGKGQRGQLGRILAEDQPQFEHQPLPITEFDTSMEPTPPRVIQISAGLNHSACLTQDNRVWIWGKYTHPDNDRQDYHIPRPISFHQPPFNNLKVEQISSGSHHTAILLEDGSVHALGITTDTVQPVMDHPVMLIPPGILPPNNQILQFQSHFDRTTIVTSETNQNQAWEVQLHQNTSNHNNVYFQPPWLNFFHTESNQLVHRVYRGWIHTIVLTRNKDQT